MSNNKDENKDEDLEERVRRVEEYLQRIKSENSSASVRLKDAKSKEMILTDMSGIISGSVFASGRNLKTDFPLFDELQKEFEKHKNINLNSVLEEKLQGFPQENTDIHRSLEDGEIELDGLRLEFSPLSQMSQQLHKCCFGLSNCQVPVSSSHVALCEAHMKLVREKLGIGYNCYGSDYNSSVYNQTLPLVSAMIKKLVSQNTAVWDGDERMYYQTLVFFKAFIFTYKRYLNPGNEDLLDWVTRSVVSILLNNNPGAFVCFLAVISTLFGLLGISLIVRDLGWTKEAGFTMTTVGSLAMYWSYATGASALASSGVAATTATAIAAAPVIPLLGGAAIAATGIGLLAKGFYNWNTPSPPRRHWCTMTLYLFG